MATSHRPLRSSFGFRPMSSRVALRFSFVSVPFSTFSWAKARAASGRSAVRISTRCIGRASWSRARSGLLLALQGEDEDRRSLGRLELGGPGLARAVHAHGQRVVFDLVDADLGLRQVAAEVEVRRLLVRVD